METAARHTQRNAARWTAPTTRADPAYTELVIDVLTISGHPSQLQSEPRSLFPRARGPKLPTCARKSPILPPKLVATPWQPLVHVEGGATPFGGTHVLFLTNRRCAWPETGTLENVPGCQCSCLNPSGNDIAINRAAKPRRRRSRTSLHATAPFYPRCPPEPCPRPPRAAA